MNTVEVSEQWKDGGDCKKCRRANYCKTECRAAREFDKKIIGKIVRDAAGIDVIEQALHAGAK